MVYTTSFPSASASAKPSSSHKRRPSHSSLIRSRRAPGAAQSAFLKKKKANIDKCLHLARWRTRADGRWDAHFGGRCALSLVAKHYRRGSLHMKWRPFMPDYYNLFHLAKWNAPQRGLWSGLKTGRLRPQRQMRNRPRVVWEDVSWILHAAISDVFLPGRRKMDVNMKNVLNLTDLNEFLTYRWTGCELTFTVFHNLIDKCNLFWDGVEKQTGTGIRNPPWWWSTKAGRQICWLSSSVGPPGSKQMVQLRLNADHTPTRIQPSPPNTHTGMTLCQCVFVCVCWIQVIQYMEGEKYVGQNDLNMCEHQWYNAAVCWTNGWYLIPASLRYQHLLLPLHILKWIMYILASSRLVFGHTDHIKRGCAVGQGVEGPLGKTT